MFQKPPPFRWVKEDTPGTFDFSGSPLPFTASKTTQSMEFLCSRIFWNITPDQGPKFSAPLILLAIDTKKVEAWKHRPLEHSQPKKFTQSVPWAFQRRVTYPPQGSQHYSPTMRHRLYTQRRLYGHQKNRIVSKDFSLFIQIKKKSFLLLFSSNSFIQRLRCSFLLQHPFWHRRAPICNPRPTTDFFFQKVNSLLWLLLNVSISNSKTSLWSRTNAQLWRLNQHESTGLYLAK